MNLPFEALAVPDSSWAAQGVAVTRRPGDHPRVRQRVWFWSWLLLWLAPWSGVLGSPTVRARVGLPLVWSSVQPPPPAVTDAPSLFISSWTVEGGGGIAAGPGFLLQGTVGQPEAGRLAGGGFVLEGGFWYAKAGLTLRISLVGQEVELNWEAPLGLGRLEMSSALGMDGSGEWSTLQLPSTAIRVRLPLRRESTFFRLVDVDR